MANQIYDWEYSSIPVLLNVLGMYPNSTSAELEKVLKKHYPLSRFQNGNITIILKVFAAIGMVVPEMHNKVYRWRMI